MGGTLCGNASSLRPQQPPADRNNSGSSSSVNITAGWRLCCPGPQPRRCQAHKPHSKLGQHSSISNSRSRGAVVTVRHWCRGGRKQCRLSSAFATPKPPSPRHSCPQLIHCHLLFTCLFPSPPRPHLGGTLGVPLISPATPFAPPLPQRTTSTPMAPHLVAHVL
jgi:hypothetical protein